MQKLKMSLSPILLFISLVLPFSAAYAGDAVRLDCLTRQNVLISFFKYHLTTMQWGKHFQIASGSHKDKTHSGARYETFSFRNGDDLIHFPKSERWFIIYADQQKPERCQVEDSFTYPVVSLPRYSGKEDALS
ncbi:hypothetical protein [Atlantibacter hermannii]|uniref:hypothetical protein n=2 Tax=Atlantibacter hermannii TaxID=565 RepID=UPI0009BA0899|nr:hypothetical protein [Atlantibacter hermannii]